MREPDSEEPSALLRALRPRVWLVSFAGWALFAVLVTATIVHTRSLRDDFAELLRDAAPSVASYVLLTPPIIALDAWLTSRRRPPWVHAVTHGAGCALFITVIHVVSMTIGSGRVLPWSWVVYALVVVLGRGHQRRLTLQARELQAASLRRQLAEARIVALQSRLQPHFLFNTLNTVSAAVESDPAKARRMLVRLSDLLRSVLDLHTPEIPLAEDLELLAPYVELQTLRFGDRLTIRLEIPEELKGCTVPALLLQPLVENAIQHGVGGRAAGGEIVVRAHTRDGSLVVSVEDDGVGIGAGQPVDGVGLGGLRERLAALYGAGGGVTLSSREPRGTRVEVRVPGAAA